MVAFLLRLPVPLSLSRAATGLLEETLFTRVPTRLGAPTMIAVLFLVLTAVFPLLFYFFIKALAWVDFRKRVLPSLSTEMNDITSRFEGFVNERVAPTNPERATQMLREAAEKRLAFAEASNVGGPAYVLLRRPGLERSLEDLVRSASSLYESRARTAFEPGPSSGE